MSADDRMESDKSHDREIELAVDDLNLPGVTAEAAEHVKGGISPPAPPAGPIAIPYPSHAPSTKLQGVSSASGTTSA